MGGSVAQAFAVRYPDRVEALGLVDTTAWYGPEAPQAWEQRAAQAEQNGLESLIDFQLPRWFGERFRAEHPEVLARFAAVFTANDVGCYGAACRMLGGYDLREHVAAVDVPTTVVVGEEDYATPPALARALHEAIAGSTLDVLPATRHLSPLERPDEIARLLAALLARRVARAPAARA
jgi:3-oxoadipate enol-lactonase